MVANFFLDVNPFGVGVPLQRSVYRLHPIFHITAGILINGLADCGAERTTQGHRSDPCSGSPLKAVSQLPNIEPENSFVLLLFAKQPSSISVVNRWMLIR